VNTAEFDLVTWIINPDLSVVSRHPKRYWKIEPDDTVVLMSATEKDAADLVVLPRVRDQIMVKIDEHVAAKIALGFQWPVATGQIFSLSIQAQIKWMGLFATTLLPPGLDKMVYPLTVPTIDDLGKYDVADQAEVKDMYSLITATVAGLLGASMTAKAAVNAAVTLAEAETARDRYLAT
jgi:hypothetical protein